jgi:hypothetical protein
VGGPALLRKRGQEECGERSDREVEVTGACSAAAWDISRG